MTTTRCDRCGEKVDPDDRFCWWCSADLSKEWEKCDKCGQRLKPDREPAKRE